MKTVNKFISGIFVALLVIGISAFSVHAFNADEHDDYMEKVLFGLNGYSEKDNEKAGEVLQALGYASYLAIDQYSASARPGDSEKLDYLSKRHIPNLPKTIDEIDFPANGWSHRRYTHRGWNHDYGTATTDKAHWETRKEILLSTVNKELKFGFLSNKILWLDYDEKCKAFAGLIYYTHIIGDHMATKYENVALDLQMIPLANRHDENIIDDLEDIFKVLFKDQKSTNEYKALLRGLNDIRENAADLVHSTGGLNTEEKYTDYQQCAKDLMELMINNVPELLKNEDFFSKVFYAD